MNFLKNFANLLMMSPCHCHLILLSHQFIITIIIIIIATFTMHHSISLPLQTQNLPFLPYSSSPFLSIDMQFMLDEERLPFLTWHPSGLTP